VLVFGAQEHAASSIYQSIFASSRVLFLARRFTIHASTFTIMKVPFTLGVVGHFGLAVRDPKRSAKWFQRILGLRKEFEFENGVAVGNDNVTIALFKGKPSPETLDHVSFHLPNMSTLRKALAHLKHHQVDVEDPGNEIGPEAPGSKNMGLWFHDPDGYRWELSVLGGAAEQEK
jgi:catechol 2,3-dioxygenase-like lactoylglutathione lyase family enzyme